MPELPEVETTRRTLAPRIEGARIEAVRLGKPLRWPLGCAPQRLVGRTVGPLERRGKYLWMPLDDEGLLLHLGMSGSLAFLPTGEEAAHAPGPHDHFDLATSRGVMRLHDPRRFGAVVWSRSRDEGAAARLLAGLGLEPFDPAFDGEHLYRATRGRRVAIKQALLAGDIVVGAGNIYACEALFDAGIDPRTPAGRLSRPRCERLAAALRHTLAAALGAGGTTLRDFRDVHGMAGAFQQQARVYAREGEPCSACGTRVRRVVQGQRSTFFCARCQRR
jgi:formamidopyrimidine-DNA glycosylase